MGKGINGDVKKQQRQESQGSKNSKNPKKGEEEEEKRPPCKASYRDLELARAKAKRVLEEACLVVGIHPDSQKRSQIDWSPTIRAQLQDLVLRVKSLDLGTEGAHRPFLECCMRQLVRFSWREHQEKVREEREKVRIEREIEMAYSSR